MQKNTTFKFKRVPHGVNFPSAVQLISALIFLTILCTGTAYAQTSPVSQGNHETKTQTSGYVITTMRLPDNFWEFVLSENGKTVFRSSVDMANPNRFATEQQAVSAAEIKAKELRAKK